MEANNAVERKHKLRKKSIRAVLVTAFGLFVSATIVLVVLRHRRSSRSQSSINERGPVAPPTVAPVLSSSQPFSDWTLPPQTDPYASPTTRAPAAIPSPDPAMGPSRTPTAAPSIVTYRPGDLGETQHGMVLSTGLNARLLATSGYPLRYDGGETSDLVFHSYPDFGATFKDLRSWNKGGWIYVSNSEVKEEHAGMYQAGVGALTFDQYGNVLDYTMLLKGTTANCGGGRTPWGSWISCEEHSQGKLWQVDPTGQRSPRSITLGQNGGWFESFAYDVRKSHYFVTEDHEFGPLRRFIPTYIDSIDRWQELHGEGVITYLRLIPDSDYGGTFEWIESKANARINANAFYPNAEGIDVAGDELYFVSKTIKTLFILKLDEGVYSSQSTRVRLAIERCKVSSMDHLHSSAQRIVPTLS
jgi:hypothetical protein